MTWDRAKQIREKLESVLLPPGCKLAVLLTANEETDRIVVLLQSSNSHSLYMAITDNVDIHLMPNYLYAIFLELDRYKGLPPTHFELDEESGSFRERTLKHPEVFDVLRN